MRRCPHGPRHGPPSRPRVTSSMPTRNSRCAASSRRTPGGAGAPSAEDRKKGKRQSGLKRRAGRRSRDRRAGPAGRSHGRAPAAESARRSGERECKSGQKAYRDRLKHVAQLPGADRFFRSSGNHHLPHGYRKQGPVLLTKPTTSTRADRQLFRRGFGSRNNALWRRLLVPRLPPPRRSPAMRGSRP